MHIGPGFLSPPVWMGAAAVSGAALAGSLAVAGRRLDDRKVPLMGVMGAFVFAAQMVNFPVLPGTSGHLGGGFLLGILLGAPLAMIVMASILIVQALVFQDGGIEALGANILVMGVMPAVIGEAVRRLWLRPLGVLADVATFLGGVAAVVLGATAVILMLWVSDSLPGSVGLWRAIGVMDLVHLVIGVVEGAASVAVARYVLKVRRDAVFGEPLAQREGAAA
ncbi:MAG: energy-coupling factor ABC transporter permease [Planctomycetes bacterium]|nr:energy-coupling factor ABC transporter permease [Planctomycetota bacterium]